MDFIRQMFLPDFVEQDNSLFPSMLSCYDLDCDQITGNSNGGRRRKASTEIGAAADDDNEQILDDLRLNKKIKHRDIERQRRQELAILFKTLRSLLPLEYIKGKRSSSDHLQEAVKYIKDLQSNIEKLSEKRDKLNRLSSLEQMVHGSPSTHRSSSSNCSCPEESTVMVMPCFAGAEIVISTCYRHRCFCVSKVLPALTEEGLTAVTCVSTKTRGGFLHNIVSEVEDVKRINFSELREKITKSKMR